MIKTDIIPPKMVSLDADKNAKPLFDLKSITILSAIGFFLDQDSFFLNRKFLRPAHTYQLGEPEGKVLSEIPWFQWHYSPRDISLKRAVSEFSDLFEKIISDQVGERIVILPLSGGLDSRTQAAALKHLGRQVHAYGYSFGGGHNENFYGKRIAQACDFPFEDWSVPSGYLWNVIERLAKINGCYSEFTHPRQMAFVDRYAALGDVFSLGHGGDLFFDDMGVPEDLPFDKQVKVVLNKIVKKGGVELGRALWQAWGLTGDFDDYLTERVRRLLAEIDIPHSANARIRAFKSLHWVPRWTVVNLSVFESVRPITIPYFDNRMCEFICTVPEKYLTNRQIQIEYLKQRAPELSKIQWQEHRPFNLYTYSWDKAPYNWPYRTVSKLGRLTSRKKVIQRNWELQFLGEDNDKRLRRYLFDNTAFSDWIPVELTKRFYENFSNVDAVKYSHSVSMLLTLSIFCQQHAPDTSGEV
jgi:hypothetical protein